MITSAAGRLGPEDKANDHLSMEPLISSVVMEAERARRARLAALDAALDAADSEFGELSPEERAQAEAAWGA